VFVLKVFGGVLELVVWRCLHVYAFVTDELLTIVLSNHAFDKQKTRITSHVSPACCRQKNSHNVSTKPSTYWRGCVAI